MIRKKLGETGAYVSAIGQGTALHAEPSSITRGIKMGMSFIDTAENYGTEGIVGIATRKIRDEAFIATKVSPENLTYDGVIKACDRSLKNLKTDHIDLYQIHWPNPAIPLDETLGAMDELVKQGKIRFIGVSNFSLKEIKAAMKITDIASIQLEFNLFDHTAKDYPGALGEKITLIGHTPLDHGRVSGSPEALEELGEIASRYEKTVAQITLNWLISHPGVIVIPKAAGTDHVEENAAACDFQMSQKDIQRIGKLFPSEVIYLGPEKIVLGEARKDYKTIEEATENPWNASPPPLILAEDLKQGEPLKPIRVQVIDNAYHLVEGGMRYWAHVLAFGYAVDIPAMVRY